MIGIALSACGSDDSADGFFSSGEFENAVDALRSEAGEDAQMLDVKITESEVEFQLRDGDTASGFVYTGDELESVDVIDLSTGSLEDQAFPLNRVDPAAVDRIVEGIEERSDADDVELTDMRLNIGAFGGGLRWGVLASGSGEDELRYSAEPDGSNLLSLNPDDFPIGGGSGAEDESDGDAGGTSPSGEISDIADCVEKAAGDPEALEACLE